MDKKLNLQLDIFEGPLDLLLHLINKLEIDIYDIPIAIITDQYMDFLTHMEEEKINVASEYFVMAATLMRIKSEMLVPRNENKANLEEEFYEDDPRRPLIEILLEYKQIKEIVPKFEEKQTERADYYGKNPVDVSAYREIIELEEQGLEINDLTNIFMDILRRKKLQEPQIRLVETEEITIEEKMHEVYNKVINSSKKEYYFSKLLETSTTQEIVVTFLALLQLIKDNHVKVEQDAIGSEIMIRNISE